MVVNTSRFLTLDKKIPQVQVNNPDVLDVVPISPNQVQISAKRTGVTQVNLWGDDKRIYTVTVIVMGDAAELTEVLRELFPRTSLMIVPVNGNSVIISGYVDQQDAVPKIVSVATKYFPRRDQQHDRQRRAAGNPARQGLRNLANEVAEHGIRLGQRQQQRQSRDVGRQRAVDNGHGGCRRLYGADRAPDNAFKFSFGGANAFYGVLGALRQDSLAKLCSEPDLVAISGRPAYMISGGSIGYQVSSTVAGNTVGWMGYGTRLDFVPIVLGNGRMHIDLRASVSESDPTNSIDGIPAFKSREVETGVELRVGQTLAIAGLLQEQTEASNQGLPWISEIPYLGVPFRSVSHQTNEIELLVMVTPRDRRRHGTRPGARLHARNADDQPQRLGTVLQRPLGSSQLLPETRPCPGIPSSAAPAERPVRARVRSAGKTRKIVLQRTRWP